MFRFEDTDKERSKKEYEDDFIDGLAWLGIDYDEGPHRQSERTDVYISYIEKMIAQNNVYISKETEGERAEVVRFKNPNIKIRFDDLIRGEIEFDTSELEDFIIARSMTEPLYHLSVVVDDYDMGITHIIRGEDGISNTARQILIQEAIGAPRPQYAHLPLILGSDRSKLSGRHGAVSVNEYRRAGYLPDALINYLALLGWHPATDQEIFTREELIQHFDLEQVQKAGAIFDEKKLRWVNRQHLIKVASEQFAEESKKFFKPETLKKLEETQRLDAAMGMVRERIEIYSDITAMDEAGEFDYLTGSPSYEAAKLAWKGEGLPETKVRLQAVLALLEGIPEASWSKEGVKEKVWPYAEQEGRGQVLWPMRYALTGRDKSPDPFEVAGILGKDETLSRIRLAVDRL